MTTTQSTKTNDMNRDSVADYLRKHPDFFDHHPELLAEINVPHVAGGAVSLVEKQVEVLREQNEQTRRRLHELIEVARQNEDLAHRMHKLILTLIDADELQSIFDTLYDNLSRNFHANKVAVRLFAKPASTDTAPGTEFVDPDSTGKALFKSVIDGRLPVNSNLNEQQQAFLFGNTDDDIASAVLVPLCGDGWEGIMVIGSPDKDRFQENMGVELLANMSEVLSFILKPWIAGR
ncbi:MAG: DUF484 family protein [Gammaproteobacteria bacterium]